MKRLLMLAGKINSGKDYTADALVSNGGWTKLTLAEYLKEYVSKNYNIDTQLLYTHVGKSMIHEQTKKSHRSLLIETAKDLKVQDPDYFVNKLIQKIKSTPITTNIVISDFRYPNEYRKILECLGNDFKVITVRVFRDEEIKLDDPSENALNTFTFDQEFDNNKRTARLNWFF